MPDHRRSLWASLAALAALTLVIVIVVADHWPPPPRDPEPDDTDQGIRAFDFKNASWLDYSTIGGMPALLKLKLKDGRFKGRVDDPVRKTETLTYVISGSPVFADVDDDGDEDAALALQSVDQGGQLSWYIWIWQDGAAQQLHYPFYRHSRCDAARTEVHPSESGFRVSTLLKGREDTCAHPPTKELHYSVGVLNSYPVRLHPALSAPDKDCFSESMREADIQEPIAARVAPEEAAPEIDAPKVYDRVEIFATAEQFFLARLTLGERTVCGWVRRTASDDQFSGG